MPNKARRAVHPPMPASPIRSYAPGAGISIQTPAGRGDGVCGGCRAHPLTTCAACGATPAYALAEPEPELFPCVITLCARCYTLLISLRLSGDDAPRNEPHTRAPRAAYALPAATPSAEVGAA